MKKFIFAGAVTFLAVCAVVFSPYAKLTKAATPTVGSTLVDHGVTYYYTGAGWTTNSPSMSPGAFPGLPKDVYGNPILPGGPVFCQPYGYTTPGTVQNDGSCLPSTTSSPAPVAPGVTGNPAGSYCDSQVPSPCSNPECTAGNTTYCSIPFCSVHPSDSKCIPSSNLNVSATTVEVGQCVYPFPMRIGPNCYTVQGIPGPPATCNSGTIQPDGSCSNPSAFQSPTVPPITTGTNGVQTCPSGWKPAFAEYSSANFCVKDTTIINTPTTPSVSGGGNCSSVGTAGGYDFSLQACGHGTTCLSSGGKLECAPQNGANTNGTPSDYNIAQSNVACQNDGNCGNGFSCNTSTHYCASNMPSSLSCGAGKVPVATEKTVWACLDATSSCGYTDSSGYHPYTHDLTINDPSCEPELHYCDTRGFSDPVQACGSSGDPWVLCPASGSAGSGVTYPGCNDPTKTCTSGGLTFTTTNVLDSSGHANCSLMPNPNDPYGNTAAYYSKSTNPNTGQITYTPLPQYNTNGQFGPIAAGLGDRCSATTPCGVGSCVGGICSLPQATVSTSGSGGGSGGTPGGSGGGGATTATNLTCSVVTLTSSTNTSLKLTVTPLSFSGKAWLYQVDWKRTRQVEGSVYINGHLVSSPADPTGSVQVLLSPSTSSVVTFDGQPGGQGTVLLRKHFTTLAATTNTGAAACK